MCLCVYVCVCVCVCNATETLTSIPNLLGIVASACRYYLDNQVRLSAESLDADGEICLGMEEAYLVPGRKKGRVLQHPLTVPFH